MSEQNPSAPIEEIVVVWTPTDEWWKSGAALRLAHWVSITVYRFPDPRVSLWAGSSGQPLPLSGEGISSARTYNLQGVLGRQVFTFKAEGDPFEAGVGSGTEYVGPLKSVRTTKQLGAGSGQFTIVAKPFAEWAPSPAETSPESTENAMIDASIVKYVDSGDWVEIVVYKADPRLDPAGSPIRTLLVGKVDSVHLDIRTPAPGGTGASTVRIEGRDVGAVYEDTIIYFNPYDPLHSNPEGRDMAQIVSDVSGSPGEIVEQMLGVVSNAAATFGVQSSTPDSGLWTPTGLLAASWSPPLSFSDTVQVESSPTRGTVFDPAILSPGQTTPLWSFVDTYGIPELNEVWVDTDPYEAGPQYDNSARHTYLYIREKPFVNLTDGADSPWFYLPNRVVHVGEIKSAALARGDNRYNYINVLIELPPNFSYDAFALCSPIYNTTSIERHGLLKLDMTLALNMIADGESDSLIVSQQIRELRNLVLCWNLLNAYYYEGSITIQGIRADLRVGQKIMIAGGPIPNMEFGPFIRSEMGVSVALDIWGPSDVFTAYIERVQYSWGSGIRPEATTTLNVSRGYADNRRLTDMLSLSKEWSEVVLAASAASTSNAIYPGPDKGDGVPS